MIIKMVIGILFAIGVYFILADVYRLPTIKTSRAITNLAKAQKEKTSSIDIWLGNFAGLIARHLPMNEFRKQELAVDLRTAQMDITPEMFKALEDLGLELVYLPGAATTSCGCFLSASI